MTRRLVFGDDGSPGADVAWLWVREHHWPGWAVDVVTCVPDARPGAVLAPWVPPHPRRFSGAQAEPPAVRHAGLAGAPAEVLADLGDADLLVVGAKGRGWRKAIGLGSVSHHLVMAAGLPLVIARAGRTTRRTVVCTDASPAARRAVDVLADLPLAAGTDALVVSVPQRDMSAGDAARSAADRLAGRVASVDWCVLEHDRMEAFHRADLVLLDLVRDQDADLVVLGSSGLSGLSARRAGSVVTTLADRAPCSVLVSRAG